MEEKKTQLNKLELVKEMKAFSGKTQRELEEFLDIFTEVTIREVSKGNKVNLQGFGCFEMIERAGRTVKDPYGKKTNVPARKSPKFSAGAEFKRRLNE